MAVASAAIMGRSIRYFTYHQFFASWTKTKHYTFSSLCAFLISPGVSYLWLCNPRNTLHKSHSTGGSAVTSQQIQQCWRVVIGLGPITWNTKTKLRNAVTIPRWQILVCFSTSSYKVPAFLKIGDKFYPPRRILFIQEGHPAVVGQWETLLSRTRSQETNVGLRSIPETVCYYFTKKLLLGVV